MKSWILIGVIAMVVVLITLWLEPRSGIFVAFAILPYLISVFIVREGYIQSVQDCTREHPGSP